MRSGVFGFVLVFSFTVQAQAQVVSPCSAHGVTSLKVRGLSHFSQITKDQDICLSQDLFVRFPPLAEIVTQATLSMKNVSSILGMTMEVLFPRGIQIILKKEEFGSFSSEASGNLVFLNQFEDWAGGGFDPSDFTHELGHVIGTTLESSFIFDFDTLPFLYEGFSDLLAYATTGKALASAGEFPSSFYKITHRNLDRLFSYQKNLGFFSGFTQIKQLYEACLLLQNKDFVTGHTKQVCSYLKKDFDPQNFPGLLAHSNEDFSWQACFGSLWNPSDVDLGCDPHQLSLPWTSGIVAMGRETLILFLKTLISPSNSIVPHSYFCHYRGDSDRTHWITVKEKHWKDFWKKFYLGLDKGVQLKWDSIFLQNFLASSYEFSDLWAQSKIAVDSARYRIMSDRYQSGSDPVYNNNNHCAHIDNRDAIHPECYVQCD